MLDRILLGKKDISSLVAEGVITSVHARIFLESDDDDSIGFVMLDFRGNGIDIGVKKQRGGQRLFSTLEAAIGFSFSVGFINVVIHNSSSVSVVDEYLADRAG